MAPREGVDADHRPDYPPRTPPPPKRPPNPPTPTPGVMPAGPLMLTAWRGVAMAHRRGANWVLENAPWSPATAGRRVTAQLHAWGYRPEQPDLDRIIRMLVGGVLHDGGRRVSVHLSDQDGQACILALSHQQNLTAGHPVGADTVLEDLAGISMVSSCGTDTGTDGRRLWAVIDL